MATGAGIEVGLSYRLDSVVEGERLVTSHVGGRGVFATPGMIWLMEWAAHHALEPHLEPGQTSVGYEVHVRHLAPVDLGATVTTTATLSEVDGRKLLFTVECREGERLIGTGTHRRALVSARP